MYICLQAKSLFKNRKRFCEMVDPLLEGQYPIRGLYQALAIAAMCVQEQPSMRPETTDVVTALDYLASQKYDPQIHPVQNCRKGLSFPRERSNGHRRTVSNDSDPRARSHDHRRIVCNGSETRARSEGRHRRTVSIGNGHSSGSETESSRKGVASPRVRSDGHRHFVSNGSETDSSGD